MEAVDSSEISVPCIEPQGLTSQKITSLTPKKLHVLYRGREFFTRYRSTAQLQRVCCHLHLSPSDYFWSTELKTYCQLAKVGNACPDGHIFTRWKDTGRKIFNTEKKVGQWKNAHKFSPTLLTLAFLMRGLPDPHHCNFYCGFRSIHPPSLMFLVCYSCRRDGVHRRTGGGGGRGQN